MADGGIYVKLTTVRFTPLFIKAEGMNYRQIEKSYVMSIQDRGERGTGER